MAVCTGITGAGERCKGIAIDSSGLCHAHHPDRAEARRRAARKGGKRGGRGRPVAELADLKARISEVVEGVLSGTLDRGAGAVAIQGLNALRAALALERDIRQTDELEERVAAVEAAAERAESERRNSSWGA